MNKIGLLTLGILCHAIHYGAPIKLSVFQPPTTSLNTEFNFTASFEEPEEVARRFISSQTHNLGYYSTFASDTYDTQDLALHKVEEHQHATHVVFQQELDGIPVFGQQLKIHLREDQSVLLMNGHYVNLEEAEIFNLRTIEQEQALSIGRRAFNLEEGIEGQILETFIPFKESLVRGYKILFIVPGKGELVALVDGTKGNVIKTYNQVLDTPRHKTTKKPKQKVESLLKEFKNSQPPRAPASQTKPDRVNPGESKKPSGWIHSSSFKTEPEMKKVELKGLDKNGHLSGTACKLENKKEAKAHSEKGEFLFRPESTHYHEVMVYFHITEMRDYLKSIGVSLNTKPTTATVHYNDDDNSFYSPARKELFFGDGGVPDSADADIILHEFGHAIVDQLSGLEGGWGSQGSAMHEGYGDYVAASFFGSPDIGEWDSSAYSEDGFLRTLKNQKKFPEDLTHQGHEDGEIWGGVLWDLYKELDKEISDHLVYHSLRFLPQDANFRDGLVAILSADETLYKGKYRKVALKVFENRGITIEDTEEEEEVQQERFNDLYTE